jgi:hypothetical protein
MPIVSAAGVFTPSDAQNAFVDGFGGVSVAVHDPFVLFAVIVSVPPKLSLQPVNTGFEIGTGPSPVDGVTKVNVAPVQLNVTGTPLTLALALNFVPVFSFAVIKVFAGVMSLSVLAASTVCAPSAPANVTAATAATVFPPEIFIPPASPARWSIGVDRDPIALSSPRPE